MARDPLVHATTRGEVLPNETEFVRARRLVGPAHTRKKMSAALHPESGHMSIPTNSTQRLLVVKFVTCVIRRRCRMWVSATAMTRPMTGPTASTL